jgi:signal transduction histidine kinase/ActR/RegA family two-component response regulator
MTDNLCGFAEQYESALMDYLVEPAEASLTRAYDLGRRALALGVRVIELGSVHGQALVVVLARRGTPDERAAASRRATEFLEEALAPFEMMLRGYQEANVLLGRLNETLEQRVEKQTVALKEADRRKDEFLATLAHELRNPLAPIRNAIQVLLLKGPPDPELKWSTEVIDRQVQHMARLLDDLLDVSRITHNKLELRRARIELATVVQNAVETSGPLVNSGAQQLTVTLPPAPVYLDADPIRLAQVFSNLLNNAAKYSEPGGHIRLTAELRGSDVVVSVKDDGMGIAVELLPRIFDIFCQANHVSERSQGGLGIGLSLVRGLVELHGGSIEARSDGPGKGSEFIVRLPVIGNKVDQDAIPPGEDGKQANVRTCRLLIVDDFKDSAESLAILLRMIGHEVHTAYDGEDALIAAEKFKPEVVLLDIGMPKLNGYDTARRIRRQPWGKEMVLVAFTGWGQEDDRRRTDQAGFDLHLVKPVDLGEITAMLASVRAETGDLKRGQKLRA